MSNEIETVVKLEDKHMADIRNIVPQIVGIRLALLEMNKWMQGQEIELDLATEQMQQAIDSLYKAEDSLGNAHQHLLVAKSTMLFRHDGAECQSN